MLKKKNSTKIIDEAFFKKLYQLYSGVIYNYLLKLTSNPEQSQDITQDTFIKLWERRKNLSEIKNYKAYLFTIAKNSLMDEFKREKQKLTESAIFQQTNSHQNTPQILMEEQELDEVKTKAIHDLSGVAKDVFLLSREQSLSYLEISNILGISKVAVKKQMMKALCTLRQKLNPYLDAELLLVLCLALPAFIIS